MNDEQRQASHPESPDKTARWNAQDWWLPIVNAILVAAAYLIFNDKLPAQIASHYDFQGHQDGSMAKGAFWLLYAALTVLLPPVISITRSLDPRRTNYDKFAGFFALFRWGISLFLQAVFVMVILEQTGYSISVVNVILGAIGALWMVLGNRMGQVKSNFFFGIRTPWALSDEDNWRRTHRLAGKLWFFAGLVMFLSAWFVPAGWNAAILIACALGSSLGPTVYSYLLYRRKLT